jgi:hypothetical protein
VYAFGLGQIDMMAMTMAMAMPMPMAMMLVIVIVIIVSEVLRQVDWLRQCQRQSFYRLRVFY